MRPGWPGFRPYGPARPRPVGAAVALSLAALSLALAGCTGGAAEPGTIRIGHFPNLTHAQALYGFESGLFEDRMAGIRVERHVFNAGPTAIEALLAGSVDVVYVGPAPTLGILQAAGSGHIRVVAGAAEGGAYLILRPGIAADDAASLAGRRFASPQLGNTQDIALKHWLQGQGQRTRDLGGDVDVVNTPNSDILGLFRHGGYIDGAWVPEPWASRILAEAGGVLHVDERDLWPGGRFITTQVVTTQGFLDSHPREMALFLAAHAEATRLLQDADASVAEAVNAGLESAGGKRLEPDILRTALAKVDFTTDPNLPAMEELLRRVEQLGFAHGQRPDLDLVVDEGPLRAAGEGMAGGHGPDGPDGTGGTDGADGTNGPAEASGGDGSR